MKSSKLLQQFADGKVSALEYNELMELLEKHSPKLKHFINAVMQTWPDSSKALPMSCVPLLRALAITSPVTAILHPDDTTKDVLNKIVNGEDIMSDPDFVHCLQQAVPLIHEAVAHIAEEAFPTLWELVKVMMYWAEKPLSLQSSLSPLLVLALLWNRPSASFQTCQ